MKIDFGDQLQIRPLTDDDLDSVVRYGNNPRIARNLEDRFPHPYTIEDARHWLEYLEEQDPLTHFAIATTNEVIGGIGLNLRHDVYDRTGEIGYWLGEPFWGRGIATAALDVFTRWVFSSLDLVRLQARVFETNAASCRVLEKAGFRYEGRLRQSVTKLGTTMDQHIYGLLRSEQPDEDLR